MGFNSGFKALKAALLPNFNKTVRCELLIIGVQQPEDVFSILSKNFRAWLQILDLEAKDTLTKNLKKYMKLDKK